MPDTICSPHTDEFNNAMDAEAWTFVDPVGDAEVQVDEAGVHISVPGGTNHTLWNSEYTLARLMQETENVNFDVEARFDTIPVGNIAQQGIVIEGIKAGKPHFLRLEFYSLGSGLYLYTGIFNDGENVGGSSTDINKEGSSISMRVQRQNSAWSVQYTFDGAAWSEGMTFNDTFEVTRMGVYAGNDGINPAYTATLRYFVNRHPSCPVVTPIIYNLEHLVEFGKVSLSWTTHTRTTWKIQYGKDRSYGEVLEGPSEALGHQATVSNLEPGQTYHLQVVVTDQAGRSTSSQDIEVRTPGAIEVWYGNHQTFGTPDRPQRWANILGQVNVPDIASLGYSLNGGALQPLKVGPDGLRLENTGDFNIELGYQDLTYRDRDLVAPESLLHQGLNALVIEATDQKGTTYRENVTVEWLASQARPTPWRWTGARLMR
ncbi:MAG: hypothetical protein HC884_06045 [Chloroflexaceae bacterium]|nr:hypothetical protein [Chloroflexaceae bacterium]